ncbi:MAG TPA: methyltransferase [Flavobacterium sp.]|jgi:release factor glutamine methyltransferase
MRTLIKKIVSPLLKSASALYLAKRRKYSYKDLSVWVEPGVFPPFITFSTKILLEFIEPLPLKDKRFLELGCGCGIISILAAKKGASVTATDINETALKALVKNAADNNVTLQITYSDLFGNLAGQSFDYIVINPPYYPKSPTTVAENAWFCGENFEYFAKLFEQLLKYISENCKVYMILSEDCAIEKIKSIVAENNLLFTLAVEHKSTFEKNFIFRISSL